MSHLNRTQYSTEETTVTDNKVNSARAARGAIKTTCDNTVPSDIVHGVAQQTTKTLASITTTEETARNSAALYVQCGRSRETLGENDRGAGGDGGGIVSGLTAVNKEPHTTQIPAASPTAGLSFLLPVC